MTVISLPPQWIFLNGGITMKCWNKSVPKYSTKLNVNVSILEFDGPIIEWFITQLYQEAVRKWKAGWELEGVHGEAIWPHTPGPSSWLADTVGRVADVCPLPSDSCWCADPKVSINRRKGYTYRHKHCDLASPKVGPHNVGWSQLLVTNYLSCVPSTKCIKRSNTRENVYVCPHVCLRKSLTDLIKFSIRIFAAKVVGGISLLSILIQYI